MLGRYFKFTSNGSNANESNHWVEIQIFDTSGTNVARSKGLYWYSNIAIEALEQYRNPAVVTDGSTTGNYLDMGGGKQSLIIDIGEIKSITNIKMWRYYNDGRIYYDTVVEVSLDDVVYETVFSSAADGTYKETSSGKQIMMPSAQSYTGDMTLLEYIQSSGTQHINTGFVPDSKTITEVKYNVQEIMDYGPHILSASNWFSAFPRRTDTTPKKNTFAVSVGSGFLYLDATSAENTDYVVRTEPGSRVIINFVPYAIGSGTYDDTTPFYMFAYGGGPTSTAYSAKAKIYYCKVWDGDTLARDFVPVQLDIGICGLYDRVGEKFYSNIGSGEFTAGPIYVPPAMCICGNVVGHSVPQSDYTQEDPKHASYIKNKPPLSGYVTSEQLNKALDSALAGYPSAEQVNTIIQQALGSYVTEQQLNSALEDAIQDAILDSWEGSY